MDFKFNDSKENLVKFVFKEKGDNPYFDGKLGVVFPNVSANEVYLGLGEKDKFNLDNYRKAIYDLGKYFRDLEIDEISFDKSGLDFSDEEFILNTAESLKVAFYNFNYYKKDKKEASLKVVNFPKDMENEVSKLDEILKVIDAQFLTRDLVNTRSNEIYPETLANRAKEELSPLGVDVKIYEKDEIEKMGLTAFLEVGKGSDKLPRLIVMEYLNSDKNVAPKVFVGKGLTYDSGGYSIKPSDGMKTMNSDMAGSATVIGAMKAIASNNLKVNVVAIVAACENAINGSAYKPGDVIKARNGMTIEVDNTDAEGRITLADAVNYGATEYKPEMIVDLATLTGAILMALGETYTGAVTNNDEAIKKVMAAAKKSNEKIWQLPNDDFIKTYNDSEVADIKNSGGRLGGSISAGQFVGAFNEDYPWVHLDIAGTAYISKPQGLNEAGATGVHVKTLYNLAKGE